ncbi:MAG: hypothetical protein ABH881_04305 [bacterium]
MKNFFAFTILVSCLILSGCVTKTSNNDVEVFLPDEKENISEEKMSVDDAEGEEVIEDIAEESVATSSEEATEEDMKSADDWRIYEKTEKNIRIKYPKDWYYQRDESENDLGYYLYVGFAPSPEVLANGAPYPVALFIISKDKNFEENLEYVKLVKEENDKKYILATDSTADYGEDLSRMAETLEIIN